MSERKAWGRRAMALEGWEPAVGMVSVDCEIVTTGAYHDLIWCSYPDGKERPMCPEDFVPDVDDDATAGHLLSMAWLHVCILRPAPGGWVSIVLNLRPGDGPAQVGEITLGRACVALLEMVQGAREIDIPRLADDPVRVAIERAHIGRGRRPRCIHVQAALGVEIGAARRVCVAYGLDPHEVVGEDSAATVQRAVD